jgi:hypothetical protein
MICEVGAVLKKTPEQLGGERYQRKSVQIEVDVSWWLMLYQRAMMCRGEDCGEDILIRSELCMQLEVVSKIYQTEAGDV